MSRRLFRAFLGSLWPIVFLLFGLPYFLSNPLSLIVMAFGYFWGWMACSAFSDVSP